MSAATMSGADAVKGVNASGSKQSLKSSTSGKALDSARKQTASPPTEGQNRKSQPPQQKAWTGTNPITQRASAVVPNGTDKSTSRPTSQLIPKPAPETNGDKHAHDRTLFLLASFTGNEATITLKNGEQFTGIFSGASLDNPSKASYTLKMVKRTRPPTSQQVNGASTEPAVDSEYIGEGEDHVMVFDKEDVVDLSVGDVMPISAQPTQNGSINASAFRTDTEISGREPSMPRERELQRWDAGADSSIDMSLDDSGATGWDQFAANEAMYGVSTTYDENIYTTQIDRSNPRYRQMEANAARIAREIEGSAPTNAHVAEERQQNASRGDGGLDEEEKYSGVRREAPGTLERGPGAYIPPSQRPITSNPTVRGAPFDPAIISSSLARPGNSAERGLEQPKAKDTEPAVQLKTPPSEPANKDAKSAGPASLQQTPAKKTEQTTEDHVRGVADSFKQFANAEKLRIRNAQEQKRTAQRVEKNVKLNDLKKFAANFKLQSRIPDDLVPILAKDHDKQKEIQLKAEQAAKEKEEERKMKERELEKAPMGGTSPSKSATSSATVTVAGPAAAAGQSGKAEIPQIPPFNRNQRMSASGRQPQPIPGTTMSPSRPNAGDAQNRIYRDVFGRQPPPQSQPRELRIPTGPSQGASTMDPGPLSPGASTRLNAGAKAFEFRPAASAFTPTTPSPSRHDAESADFFAKAPSSPTSGEEKDDDYSGVHQQGDDANEQKPQVAAIGGLPQPYRTHPAWGSKVHDGETYKELDKFIPTAPTPSQTHSQVHTPNPNAGHMPQGHQIPPHMPGQQMGTPSSRAQYIQPHHLPPNMPQHHHNQFVPGHFPGTNGSVQSSPRHPGAQLAAFNGQIPPNMGMPQYANQQFNGQQMGMQGYGMSPSMPYRQVQMPGMPPGGPNGMMMMPGNQGQHGQMPNMPPYGRQPQQYNPNFPPGAGGVPMQNQASAPGFPMQQPGGQPGQFPSSPMPPHATPHLPHQQPHHMPFQHSPYNSSPRPHMMAHTASHQGFNHNGQGHGHGGYGHAQQMGGYGGGGPGMPQQAGMGYGQMHHPPYGMGNRQMSAGGYSGHPAMTPRGQNALPMPPQASPGMGGTPGGGGGPGNGPGNGGSRGSGSGGQHGGSGSHGDEGK